MEQFLIEVLERAVGGVLAALILYFPVKWGITWGIRSIFKAAEEGIEAGFKKHMKKSEHPFEWEI